MENARFMIWVSLSLVGAFLLLGGAGAQAGETAGRDDSAAAWAGTYALVSRQEGFCPSRITVVAEDFSGNPPGSGLGIYCASSAECTSTEVGSDGVTRTRVDTIVYQFANLNLGPRKTLLTHPMLGYPVGWRSSFQRLSGDRLEATDRVTQLSGKTVSAASFEGLLQEAVFSYSVQKPHASSQCVYRLQ
ncbi:MAG: hypothetical protein NDJ89_09450 [Oligoflexia bacterium]|nr:hypothetical protein [Oligoflexia bacterium]